MLPPKPKPTRKRLPKPNPSSSPGTPKARPHGGLLHIQHTGESLQRLTRFNSASIPAWWCLSTERNPMKFQIFILLGLALVGAPYAQERTAGGTLDTQMTWSALSAKIDAVSLKSDAVNTRVDQVVVCGKKGMTYAPGTQGADAEGCMAPQSVTKIVNCGNQGAVYSPATDTCIKASQGRWYVAGTAPATASSCDRSYRCSTYAINPPAGYPACSGNNGIAARLCTNSNERCSRARSSSSSTYVPPSCTKVHFGDSQSCNDGGNVTTTSTWYELFACE